MCQNLHQGGQMLPGVSLDLYNNKSLALGKKKQIQNFLPVPV